MTTARKPAAKTVTAAARRGKKAPVRTTWRNRQTVPTPERYREIQNALVAKGYLAPEAANGAWDQASVDALKKFQAEQNIESTGKINSLSLIALGLGPKHDTASTVRPAEGGNGQTDPTGHRELR
ncbi:MAG TPA: peptidoglycan-binding domain-containing protein [Bryobacteraceae bacterium]|nr:peptidoglycan-binding domain-containing protein [Bryobacteraceae bacterium]